MDLNRSPELSCNKGSVTIIVILVQSHERNISAKLV